MRRTIPSGCFWLSLAALLAFVLVGLCVMMGLGPIFVGDPRH